MRKPILLLLATLLLTTLFGQEGTTLDEYRYLSKGYVYQLEMGLDAQKEGYSVKDIFTATNQGDLVGLYKDGQSMPRALLVILDTDKAKNVYVCVPNSTAPPLVKELASKDQAELSTQHQLQYQNALNEFLFAALSSADHRVAALHEQAQHTRPYSTDPPTATSTAASDMNVKSPAAVVVPTTTRQDYTPSVPALETATADQFDLQAEQKVEASKATILGELSTRNVLESSVPKHNSRNRGIVAIKICVDQNGVVKTAKFTQRGSTTFNASLKAAAIKAAKKIKFAKINLDEQCGIVKYDFL